MALTLEVVAQGKLDHQVFDQQPRIRLKAPWAVKQLHFLCKLIDIIVVIIIIIVFYVLRICVQI